MSDYTSPLRVLSGYYAATMPLLLFPSLLVSINVTYSVNGYGDKNTLYHHSYRILRRFPHPITRDRVHLDAKIQYSQHLVPMAAILCAAHSRRPLSQPNDPFGMLLSAFIVFSSL